MSNSNTQAQSGGIGFIGLLTIVFITLKLTHFIDWTWKWVLAPIWIPFALIAVFVALMFIGAIANHILKQRAYKKKVASSQPRFMSDLDRRR